MMIDPSPLHRAGRALAVLLLLLAGAPAVADEQIEVPGAAIGRMGEPAAVDPDAFEFSEAETRLWMSNHLENIERPARLYYEFVKSGTFEDGFTDSVYLDVLEINPDGSRDTDMQFFTGHREQPYSPENVNHVTGNPVLLVYMRGDVHDMNRLTQGNWRYFQRSIKLALAQGARMEPVTVQFDGRDVEAQKIMIRPYVEDPRRRRFEQFAGKYYEFVLSEQIPGTLFQIRTVVPGEGEGADPLIEETLTLQSVQYRGG